MAFDSRTAIDYGQMTVGDIPDALVLPSGHYYATVLRFAIREGVRFTDRNGREVEAKVVDFFVGNLQPSTDIDPSKLDDLDLSSMELQQTYWYTPTGIPDLRDFIASFRFPPVPIESLYHETVGRRVLCTVAQREYERKRDKKKMLVANLDKMIATEPERVSTL